MEPSKYSRQQAKTIDLGTKTIYKYPTPTKDLDIGYMIVNGRHPEVPGSFIVEHACSFVMYIIKGHGRFFVGEKIFAVVAEDVVFVPANHRFAVEGELEYITVDSPAFFPEQSEEIKTSDR